MKKGTYLLLAIAFLLLVTPIRGASGDEIDDIIHLLSQRWNVKIEDAQIGESLERVSGKEDQLIDRLMREFNHQGQTFAFGHRVVRVMEAIGTENAQVVLLDIAMGNIRIMNEASLEGWGSRAFIATLEDKSRAKVLLDSQVDGVINNALLALKGCSIDSDLLAKLQEFTGSENFAIRRAAVSVMAEAPNAEYASEKANAILASLHVAEKYPKANDIYWPGYSTYRESEYSRSIQALAKVKGVGAVLEDLTSETTGRMLYCILLARAQRGDASVKKDILKIAQDPNIDMMRARAVSAIATIGGPEDIRLLEKIAASDPLQRKRGGCLHHRNEELFYPVRQAAKSAIRRLEAKGLSKGDS